MAGLLLDRISAAAAYSVRKVRTNYSGPCMNVRRSSDNAAQDIGFDAVGNLDLDALTLFCGAPIRPLLALPLAAAAYSLRRLGNYGGPSVRVRRSSDNTELDIGFVGNNLDTAALLAFVGTGSGFASILYDQSGNGRNATQSTLALQPRIVNAGVVDTLGGRPTLTQVSSTESLNIPIFSGMTSAAAFTVYTQVANNSSSPFQLGAGGGTQHLPFSDSIAYVNFFSTSRPTFSPFVSPAGAVTQATTLQTGTELSLFRNGNQVGSAQVATFGLPSRREFLGASGGLALCSELIVLAVAPSPTERALIEQSQAAYYSITYASTIPSGFVTIWYDQSGNGRHATQTIAGQQPRIVNAGVVNLLNSRPTCGFDFSGLNIVGSQVFASASVVLKRDINNPLDGLLGGVGTDQGIRTEIDGLSWRQTAANEIQQFTSVNGVQTNRPAAAVIPNSGLIDHVFFSNFTGNFTYPTWVIGGYNGARVVRGRISEFVLFDKALNQVQISFLEKNQGAYYNIAVA